MRPVSWFVRVQLLTLVVLLFWRTGNAIQAAAVVNLETACANGLQVDINGGAAPGQSVTSITWDWGDGTILSGFFPQSHTYGSQGQYKVTVTAHFSDGEIASGSEMVSVGSGTLSGCLALTITAGQYGSVNYQASVGSGTVPAGSYTTLELDFADDLSVTANPGNGFSFSSWSPGAGITGLGGSAVSVTSPSTTIVVDGSSTIGASFSLSLTPPPLPTATPPLSSFPSVPQLFTNQASSFFPLFSNQTSSDAQSWLTSSSIATNVSSATDFLSLNPPSKANQNPCLVSNVKQDLCTISTDAGNVSTAMGLAGTVINPLDPQGYLETATGIVLSTPEAQTVLDNTEVAGYQLVIDGASSAASCAEGAAAGGLDPLFDASCVLSIGSVLGDVTSDVASALVATDPPGPDYADVFVPEPIIAQPVPSTAISQELAATAWASVNSVDEATMWMNALRVTANRYGTALANGDAASAGMQYMAFLNYFGLYLNAAGKASVDLRNLANVLSFHGLGTQSVTDEQIQNGLSFLETEATSSPFINNFFTSLGFTSDQIQTMIEEAEANPPSPPSTTPVEALQTLANAFAPAGVHLVTTLRSLTVDSETDGYVATLTITNTGGSPATGVTVASAELNATSASGLPVTVGNLGYAQSATATVEFPSSAGGVGNLSVLRFSESYADGTAGGGFRVVLP